MKKILIVDDEVICTIYLGSFLQDNGYETQTSTTGEEAIALGQSLQPDILITDWMLKDKLDGLDVAQSLRTSFPDIKVIFITGMAQEALAERLPPNFQCTIIEKPLNLDLILQTAQAYS